MHNKNSPWYSLGLKYGFPNIYWTETVSDSIIATPINTYSNIFYILAGLLCLDNYIFGLAVILLGFGSSMYHCSVIYPCQLMDISSMSLVFSVMTSQHLELNEIYTYLVILLYQLQLFLFVKYKIPLQYNSITNISSIILTIPEYNIYVYLSLSLFLYGLFNSYLDIHYKYIYGHAMWHLFTALSLYTWNLSQKKYIL